MTRRVLRRIPANKSAAECCTSINTVAVGATRPGVGVDATSLQIPGVLDDLNAAKATPVTLGPSFRNGQVTLRAWAPTARALSVRLFADSDPATAPVTYPMPLAAWGSCAGATPAIAGCGWCGG